jgi:hypothetical protein
MGAILGPIQAKARFTDWRHHRTTPITIGKRFCTAKTPDSPTGGITAQRQSLLESVFAQPRP